MAIASDEATIGVAMTLRASEFEFRYRIWFIAGIIWLGFLLYNVDHTNLSVALARAIVGSPDRNPIAFDHWVRAFFWLGTAIVAFAAWIRSWAESYLHSSIVHDAALHSEQLVADGPFRYLRNPLYLGTILLPVGLGVLASATGAVIMSVGMTLFVYRLILREEATLLQSQGESYRRYFNAVPRLIPSLRPRVPASGAKPNWVDGFTGEIFMWAGAAAMAVFAITERLRYFWIALGSGFVVYFLQYFFRIRRKSPA